MKRLFFTVIALLLYSTVYSSDDLLNITGSGNFTLSVSDRAGHHVPAVDFFRRFERVVRRIGRIEEGSAARGLLLILDEKQPSGSSQFEHSRKYRRQVLKLPVDYRSLLDFPAVGRVIASALIQSRLGNHPQEPLPEAARWVADGLWAEFVHRERTGEQIVRFTWLDGLRNIVENDGKLVLNNRTLQSPEKIRPGSAEWTLYCQKAQLMLETANALGSSRNNLLKDYCFLLFGRQLSAEDCFAQTFIAAAKRKIYTPLTPVEVIPKDEKLAGQSALDRMALKSLYSQYVPMGPFAAGRRFEQLCRVTFRQDSNNAHVEASISDLPFLAEKYAACTPLPGVKIFELNELTHIAPPQLRGEFYQLSYQLGQIGSDDPDRVSSRIKKIVNDLRRKFRELQQVDSVLKTLEKSMQPLLFEQRFLMYENLPDAPLPEKTGSFIDTVERSLQR